MCDGELLSQHQPLLRMRDNAPGSLDAVRKCGDRRSDCLEVQSVQINYTISADMARGCFDDGDTPYACFCTNRSADKRRGRGSTFLENKERTLSDNSTNNPSNIPVLTSTPQNALPNCMISEQGAQDPNLAVHISVQRVDDTEDLNQRIKSSSRRPFLHLILQVFTILHRNNPITPPLRLSLPPSLPRLSS